MAGIGFQLKRLLEPRTFLSALQAYGFAGLIAAGPWVLSVAATTLVGLLAGGSREPQVVQFLVAVTWLMAASLIFTGPLQLLFSRFAADRAWEKRAGEIAPNLLGALLCTTVAAALAAGAALALLFGAQGLRCKVLLFVSFVVLCDLWLLVVVLSGLKRYAAVLLTFCGGYGLTIACALGLRRFGLDGLLASFALGQSALLFPLLGLALREYPPRRMLAFDFIRQGRRELALCGLVWNVAIWADKLVFWLSPQTGEAALGPLRSSLVYDLPIFLAYLSVIPGSAAFLLRVETDFAQDHHAFYEAIRTGASLQRIEELRDGMTLQLRSALYDLLRIQLAAGLLFRAAGPWLLPALGVSPLYLPLFGVDLVGAGLQVLLLGVLNALFYFDRRSAALAVCALFAVANGGLSLATVLLGPQLYGFGAAVAAGLSIALGLGLLSRTLGKLEYETYMLQA